jgi:hypothetical protein
MFGSIGPSVRWDILNYGRILNNVRAQDARFQQLAYNYQNTVLTAGREAEDAIVGFLQSQEQTARLADSVRAAQRTVDITVEQYRQGAVDFTAVFLFEGTLADQQDQLAVSRANITLNLIRLYRALGGGWEMRLSRDNMANHHVSGHTQDVQNGQHPVAVGPPPALEPDRIVSVHMTPISQQSRVKKMEQAPAEILPPLQLPAELIQRPR